MALPLSSRLPTLYIPHGGGPCFFMDDMPGLPPGLWNGMAAYLRGAAASLPVRPSRILVVTAHWECPLPTVGAAATHTLYYDYYGFPEHTYHLTYPAPGAPELARRVRNLLEGAGIACALDEQRGIDHGVFIPLKLMVPQADIPVVPLSLQEGLDPLAHAAIGRALAPLRDEGVLIVGSGMSYHNLARFFSRDPQADAAAHAFHQWLAGAVQPADAALRNRALAAWQAAPGGRDCHPRAEHLLPLMVAAGAGLDDAGSLPYRDKLLGKAVCAVQFG